MRRPRKLGSIGFVERSLQRAGRRIDHDGDVPSTFGDRDRPGPPTRRRLHQRVGDIRHVPMLRFPDSVQCKRGSTRPPLPAEPAGEHAGPPRAVEHPRRCSPTIRRSTNPPGHRVSAFPQLDPGNHGVAMHRDVRGFRGTEHDLIELRSLHLPALGVGRERLDPFRCGSPPHRVAPRTQEARPIDRVDQPELGKESRGARRDRFADRPPRGAGENGHTGAETREQSCRRRAGGSASQNDDVRLH